MQQRTLTLLTAAALLVVPTLALDTAMAVQGPDMTVASFVVGRLVFPYRWSFTTTICNVGKDIAPAGSVVTWTAQPKDGLLATAGDRDVRVVGTVQVGQAFAPGECTVLRTSWNTDLSSKEGFGLFDFGEWTFTAGVTIDGDRRPRNNVATAEGAWPVALAGTGAGGFDLP